jgi:hypothetical protein
MADEIESTEAAPQEAAQELSAAETDAETEAATQAEGGEPTEAKPEAKKKPEDIFAKIAKRRAKLDKREAALTEARRNFEAQTAQVQAQLKELQELKQTLSLAKENPLAFLEKTGVSYDKITEATLRAGTPDEQIALLRRELEGFKEADKKSKEEGEKRALEERAARGREAFLGVVKRGDYPELALYEDSEVVDAADRLAPQLADELGRRPTLGEVAGALERLLVVKREALEKRRTERAAKTSPPAEKGKAPPKTLTNRAAGESAGQQRELSWEERRALATKMLDDLFAG